MQGAGFLHDWALLSQEMIELGQLSCDLLPGEPEVLSYPVTPVFVTIVLVYGAGEPHFLLCVSMDAFAHIPGVFFALDCCHIVGFG